MVLGLFGVLGVCLDFFWFVWESSGLFGSLGVCFCVFGFFGGLGVCFCFFGLFLVSSGVQVSWLSFLICVF